MTRQNHCHWCGFPAPHLVLDLAFWRPLAWSETCGNGERWKDRPPSSIFDPWCNWLDTYHMTHIWLIWLVWSHGKNQSLNFGVRMCKATQSSPDQLNEQEHLHELSKAWTESFQPRNGTRLPMTCFRRSGQQMRARTTYLVSSQRSTIVRFANGLLVNSTDFNNIGGWKVQHLEGNQQPQEK